VCVGKDYYLQGTSTENFKVKNLWGYGDINSMVVNVIRTLMTGNVGGRVED
jgi:hypothetical protein